MIVIGVISRKCIAGVRRILPGRDRLKIAEDHGEPGEPGGDQRDDQIDQPRRHLFIASAHRPMLRIVERPAKQLFIAVDPRPRRMILLTLRRQEIGGDHRRDHARDRKADEHREYDGHAELDEELARHARHQRDGQEHRDDRHRRRDDREADFVGGIDRRLIGGLAHAHVPHDILDLDDRIVNQHPRDEAQREQRQRRSAKSPSFP